MIRILFFLLLFSSLNFGQRQTVGWISKFGLAGGFTPIWVKPDLQPINDLLKANGLNQFNDNGIIAYGGSGYIYIMLIKNLRIGGIGYGGGKESITNLVGSKTTANYSYGGGAVTLEYTLPFIKKIAVSLGTNIGGGFSELEITKSSGTTSWEGVWNSTLGTNDGSYSSSRIKSNFWTISPTLNIDVPVNRFIALRLGGGYLFSIGDDWETPDGQVVSSVPKNLNGDTFFIQTGVLVGFFAF